MDSVVAMTVTLTTMWRGAGSAVTITTWFGRLIVLVNLWAAGRWTSSSDRSVLDVFLKILWSYCLRYDIDYVTVDLFKLPPKLRDKTLHWVFGCPYVNFDLTIKG